MQSLKNSELRYRCLFEAAQDGILILDAETGMIEDVNPYLIKMLGYSHEEFTEKRLWEIGAFKDMESSQNAFETLRENKYIRYEDLPLKTKDGRLMQVEFVSNVYMVGEEKVIQCNIRDITERKLSEKALRESEERYRMLVEQAADGIFITDSEGRFIEVNSAGCCLLGYTSEEILQKTLRDVTKLAPGEPLRFDEVRQGKTITIRREMIRKDGALAPVETSAKLLPDGRVQGIVRDITERERAEHEITSLAKFPSENPNPVLRLSQDGIVMYANAASGALLKNWGCAVGDSAPQRWRDLTVQALASGETETVDVEYNGKVYSMFIAPVAGMSYVNIYGRDITKRKQAEDALRVSEEKFRKAFFTSPDSININRLADGMYVSINAGFSQIMGYSAEEIVGKTSLELNIWATPKDRKALMRALMKNGEVADFEACFRTKNGDVRCGLMSAAVFELNNAPHILSITRDITERKRMEEALQESEKRFRNLVNNSPDVIYVLDLAERRPTFFNRQGFCGYSRQELQAQNSMLTAVHPDDLGAVSTHWEVLRNGDPAETRRAIEYRFKHKDGNWEWVQSRAAILTRDKKDRPTQALVTLTLITEQKQAKAEMQQRLNELEVLHQSSMEISQLMNPKAIAEKMLDLLDQKKDWHHTAIRLYHPEDGTLELLAFHLPQFNSPEERSAAEERFKAMRQPSQGLSGWVVQHGQALRSSDLKSDPRYYETFPGLCSGLYVPIKIATRVIGVISIESERPKAFTLSDERLVMTLARQAAAAMDDAQLFENLKRSNIDLTLAYDATIEGWSRALDLRNKEAEGHSQRVTDMTLRLAHSMGVSDEELAHIRRGALLHDIGKISVPDEILLKAGSLTDEEWAVMKKHPIFAYEMLSPIYYLRSAVHIPHCHHEKWDGSGYPRGLKGDQIPLAARIFAVVDVWDTLCSDRPYRACWAEEKVREYICSSSGTHFDPQVVDAFMQMLQ
ncbi:MAG: PAS domain S-box protein [Anaerolineales bacterium]